MLCTAQMVLEFRVQRCLNRELGEQLWELVEVGLKLDRERLPAILSCSYTAYPHAARGLNYRQLHRFSYSSPFAFLEERGHSRKERSPLKN